MLSEVLTEEISSGRFRFEANDCMEDLIHKIKNSGTHAVNRGDVLEALKNINNESYVRAKVEAGYVTANFSRKAIGILQNILDIPLQAIKRDVPTVSLANMFQYGMSFGGMFMISPAFVPAAKVDTPLEQPISNSPATTFTEKNQSVQMAEEDIEDFGNDDNPFLQGYLQHRR
ncbi:TPA: hypothetical protein ACTXXA_002542 [Legionella anisa]